MSVRACARACGQKYRSVHPALPPSVLGQASGHYMHTHPLHTDTGLFVFVASLKHEDVVGDPELRDVCSLKPVGLKPLNCISVDGFHPGLCSASVNLIIHHVPMMPDWMTQHITLMQTLEH